MCVCVYVRNRKGEREDKQYRQSGGEGRNVKNIRLTVRGRGAMFLHKAGSVLRGTDNGLSYRAVWLPAVLPASFLLLWAAGSGPGMSPPEALLILLKQQIITAAAVLRFFSQSHLIPNHNRSLVCAQEVLNKCCRKSRIGKKRLDGSQDPLTISLAFAQSYLDYLTGSSAALLVMSCHY